MITKGKKRSRKLKRRWKLSIFKVMHSKLFPLFFGSTVRPTPRIGLHFSFPPSWRKGAGKRGTESDSNVYLKCIPVKIGAEKRSMESDYVYMKCIPVSKGAGKRGMESDNTCVWNTRQEGCRRTRHRVWQYVFLKCIPTNKGAGKWRMASNNTCVWNTRQEGCRKARHGVWQYVCLKCVLVRMGTGKQSMDSDST